MILCPSKMRMKDKSVTCTLTVQVEKQEAHINAIKLLAVRANIDIYYIMESVSGQDEANPAF